jgi:hypothetical protein
MLSVVTGVTHCENSSRQPEQTRHRRGKHLIDARIRKFTFQHNFQPGKSTLIRQFRRCMLLVLANKSAAAAWAVNQAGEKMADVVIH